MKTSEQGLALIRKNEGFSAKMYFCPAGKPTIGYGHVISADENFPTGGISEYDAKIILIQDVSQAEQALNRLIKVTISQNQFDALAAFTYNIGIGAFENSTLLRLLNDGDIAGASHEFSRWVYANGKILGGLVNDIIGHGQFSEPAIQ